MIDLMTLREFVWGPWLLCLFLAAGVCMAARLAGDLTRARARGRAGALPDEKQFLTSCTALAATLGTGNIAGVATALTAGGPGAVFWMWICALLGMATAYGETYLGIRYRKKGADQSWLSGPFLYLSDGLKKPAAGCCYAVFCMLAALGMGSMVQANSIAESVSLLAPIDPAAAAVVVTALAASVFLSGVRPGSRLRRALSRLRRDPPAFLRQRASRRVFPDICRRAPPRKRGRRGGRIRDPGGPHKRLLPRRVLQRSRPGEPRHPSRLRPGTRQSRTAGPVGHVRGFL